MFLLSPILSPSSPFFELSFRSFGTLSPFGAPILESQKRKRSVPQLPSLPTPPYVMASFPRSTLKMLIGWKDDSFVGFRRPASFLTSERLKSSKASRAAITRVFESPCQPSFLQISLFRPLSSSTSERGFSRHFPPFKLVHIHCRLTGPLPSCRFPPNQDRPGYRTDPSVSPRKSRSFRPGLLFHPNPFWRSMDQ